MGMEASRALPPHCLLVTLYTFLIFAFLSTAFLIAACIKFLATAPGLLLRDSLTRLTQ